jgi:Flp pilus assembly protein TadD
MNKVFRPLLAAISLAFSAGAFAAGVLIVPEKPIAQAYADPQGNLLEMIASYLDEDGRISPVAWTMTDRIYRTAADAGQVPKSEFPTEDIAEKAAATLKCDYILYVSIWRDQNQMLAKSRLVHRNKQIWHDPKVDEKLIEVMKANAKNDPEKKPFDEARMRFRILTVHILNEDGTFDTLRTLARTWTEQLFLAPFKEMQPRPRMNSIQNEGGVATIPNPPPAEKVDNQELLTKVMAMMAKGDRAGAITAMRDAVDIAPLDTERRRVLVEVLSASGFHAEAAKQARRAATILEKPTEMYVLAAKSWLAADNPAEAQLDLKEAVSREPESASVRALLGELSLREGKYEDAVKHFSVSIERGEDSGVLFQRAIAYVLNGDGAKARADLERAKSLGLTPALMVQKNLYAGAINMISAAAIRTGSDFRDLVQKIKQKPFESGWGEEVDTIRMRCDSMQLFLKELTPPAIHSPSHGERSLGIKLLLESITLMESFLKETNDDVLAEAHISLGEGLKRLLDAREMYVKELPQ